MYRIHTFENCILLALLLALFSSGTLGAVFITHPYAGITCHAGQDCVVTWADDGTAPLLNAVGPSDIALYMDSTTLVQQLAAGLDKSQTRSLTFKPDPKAGPNASSYYIWLTSLSANDPNNATLPYVSFSGRFTIDDMSGTDGKPVASDTSSLSPISSPTALSSTNGIVSTTTLSPPSGVTPTITPSSTSSSSSTSPSSTATSPTSFQTSRSASSSSGTSSSSTATPTSSTSAATRTVSFSLWRLGAAGVVASLLSLLL